MMEKNLDACFVEKLLAVELTDYHSIIMRVTPEMIGGDARSAYLFIKDFIGKYGEIPTKKIVLHETGIEIGELADAGIDYYVNEIVERDIFRKVDRTMAEVGRFMDKGKASDALEAMEKSIKSISSSMSSDSKSLFSVGEEFRKQYFDVKSGKVGIETPWESLNTLTMGWQPADFVTFVARPGVGKTFLLIFCAHYAWSTGSRILFFSPEIHSSKVFARFIAKDLSISYKDIRGARLGDAMEEKIFRKVEEWTKIDDGRFQIMGEEFGVDFSFVERNILKHRPDIIFVDGLYLLRIKGLERMEKHERIAEISDRIKGMAKKYGIPIVCASQLNRGGDKRKELNLSALAFSDVIGMNADYIFGLFQDDDMRIDRRMAIIPMKVREADKIGDVELNWNFDTMDFSEIVGGSGGGGKPSFGMAKPDSAFVPF